jgi:hypothetical protein
VLAVEHQLTKQLTFEKVEATDADSLVILRTAWERAAELGIDPQSTISFLANVIQCVMVGFRPGCLDKVCYKDIALSIFGDPQNPSRMKYAATITIKRNKIKESLSASKADT